MSKNNAGQGRAPTQAAQSNKGAGTDKAPAQTGHIVAKGQRFELRGGGLIGEGESIKASDLKTTKDADGKREFERQVKAGTIIRGGKSPKPEDDAPPAETTASTGAAPSGAQVLAAQTDEEAAKVVDAAQTGDAAALAKANDTDPQTGGSAE